MRYFVKLTFLFGLTACQPFSSNEILSNTGGRLSNLQIGQAGSSIDLGFSGPSGVVLTELPDSAIDGAVPVTVSPIKKDISLSNEQDFDAVASEQSIESDAARIAANREKYIVVEVKDLPTREGLVAHLPKAHGHLSDQADTVTRRWEGLLTWGRSGSRCRCQPPT